MDHNNHIQIVLADDHPTVMKGFAMALMDFDITVLGQATTPEDALKMYEDLSPDVLVLDIRFGENLTGLDVARKILEKHSAAKIVFLSQFDQANLIREAYRLGGSAFITKNCDPANLATAIQRAHEGHIYFLPHVAEQLASLSVRDTSPQSKLEPRELEIFTLIANGHTNAEIAEQLNLSLRTVSSISQTVKDKLSISRTSDFTKLAIKHGLIVIDSQ